MPAPDSVLSLVERFREHRDEYLSAGYNEATLRREFLEPMFKALGWDVDNTKGYAEAYKEVVHEDAIKISGATKAPDYAFRLGGVRKFFVEAKKPSVDVKGDPSPAYQLRRYAWSAKLPLSILTDFHEFAVYDCTKKPDPADTAATCRILYLTCEDYAKRWEEIAELFSPEAIQKGAFDKHGASAKKKGTTTVDDAFLKEIETWRDLLAHNLALRNPGLTQRELNTAVQTTIDRIIFLRICEDRGIEEYGVLRGLVNGTCIYARMLGVFRAADERYNSGLFHFRSEKDRPGEPDTLTLGLVIDDKTLREILDALYYPKSPYEFSVLPADILGHVYEQFLGKVIRLTAGHHAVVEEKPEVKKAGGVYYTPTYIVDYIVKNTVGKLLEGTTPKEAGSLRILDPACGSGSFLLGAYQSLLNYHQAWYAGHDPEKWARGRRPKVFHGQDGEWRLTTAERKRILLDCIYGVDIDPQAVEVTKLSLLLKVLEGEDAESIGKTLKLLRERALPDLGRNIQCGNSLIGTDFYDEHLIDTLTEEERYRINAFDWETAFPDIMKQGGFEAVIGNPPWGASFTEHELQYLSSRHRGVIDRMGDSYIYFLDLALSLTGQRGVTGFIVPGTILNQADASSLRHRLLDHRLSLLVNLGQGVFGRRVLNTSAILVTVAPGPKGLVHVGDVASEGSLPVDGLEGLSSVAWDTWKELCLADPHATFFVSNLKAAELLRRLRAALPSLGSILDGTIQRGVTPDAAQAHVVSQEDAQTLGIESELLRPSISGAAIKRYTVAQPHQHILYTTRATPVARYPRALAHLAKYRHLNTCPEVAQGKHPWWALHRPRSPEIFDSPKIIGLTTTNSLALVLDPASSLFVTDAMYVFRPLPEYSPAAVIAVMQSRAFGFLYRVANQGESRVIPQVKASKLEPLPIPAEACRKGSGSQDLETAAGVMLALTASASTARTEHERDLLQRQVDATDRKIDELVYELYGLTADEIRMVDEATRV